MGAVHDKLRDDVLRLLDQAPDQRLSLATLGEALGDDGKSPYRRARARREAEDVALAEGRPLATRWQVIDGEGATVVARANREDALIEQWTVLLSMWRKFDRKVGGWMMLTPELADWDWLTNSQAEIASRLRAIDGELTAMGSTWSRPTGKARQMPELTPEPSE